MSFKPIKIDCLSPQFLNKRGGVSNGTKKIERFLFSGLRFRQGDTVEYYPSPYRVDVVGGLYKIESWTGKSREFLQRDLIGKQETIMEVLKHCMCCDNGIVVSNLIELKKVCYTIDSAGQNIFAMPVGSGQQLYDFPIQVFMNGQQRDEGAGELQWNQVGNNIVFNDEIPYDEFDPYVVCIYYWCESDQEATYRLEAKRECFTITDSPVINFVLPLDGGAILGSDYIQPFISGELASEGSGDGQWLFDGTDTLIFGGTGLDSTPDIQMCVDYFVAINL